MWTMVLHICIQARLVEPRSYGIEWNNESWKNDLKQSVILKTSFAEDLWLHIACQWALFKMSIW